MELNIEKVIKDRIQHEISKQIDEEINIKVNDFKRTLEDRKDRYISEVMTGIRIFHEQSQYDNSINYRITFENIYRVGK